MNAGHFGFRLSALALLVCASIGGYLTIRRGGATVGLPRPSVGDLDKSESGKPRLSESERQFLWETENEAFQLSYKACPRLAEALVAADSAELTALFAESIDAVCPDLEGGDASRHGPVTVRTHSPKSGRPVHKSRGELVAWLLAQRSRFRGTPYVLAVIPLLSPVSRDNLQGPWRGVIVIRLNGEEAAPGEANTIPPRRPAGTRRDLFPPLYRLGEGRPLEIVIRAEFEMPHPAKDYLTDSAYLSHWVVEQMTVSTCPKRLMEDITSRCGIAVENLYDSCKTPDTPFMVLTGGIFACDYNRDGCIDLLVTDRSYPTLYAGDGTGKFVDQTVAAGLPWGNPTAIFAAFADLDNDHDEDLILGKLVLENRDNQFVRRGQLAIPSAKNVAGLSVADFDRDGLVDVYVSNAAPPPDESEASDRRISWIEDETGLPNVLLHNRGNFKFEDVTAAANASGGFRSTFSSAWLDADDDGWPDIYVINELGSNILLRNRGNGSFEEVSIGPEHDGFAMGIAAGDVNGDGRIDLYIGNMKSKVGQRILANMASDAYPPRIMAAMKAWVGGNLLLTNNGKLGFDATGRGIDGNGWSYGPTLFDLDNDGWLDIHSTCGYASRSRQEPDG